MGDGTDRAWWIGMLGGLRAERDGHVVSHFETRRTGALLAFLAYHPDRAYPREVLMELLWPEEDPEATRGRLRQTLACLRRAVELPGMPHSSVLIADRAEVRLAPGAVTTDASRFEACVRQAAAGPSEAKIQLLGEAMDLYHGELLPGYYEEWIGPERQRLADLHLQTRMELAAALADTGEFTGAIEHARRAIAADPLREEAHCLLMRLFAQAGRQADARRQYRDLEQLLCQELRSAPSAAARELLRQIESGGAESVGVWAGAQEVVGGCIGDSAPKPAGAAASRPTEYVAPTASSRISSPALPYSHTPILPHSHTPTRSLESPGGAVPPGSPYYVVRAADSQFEAALNRRDGIVLVKGARQVGKSSLLARGLHQARQQMAPGPARVVITDFQTLTVEQLGSAEALFLALAQGLADQLGIEAEPATHWNPRRSWMASFQRYLLQEVLGSVEGHLVWGMDEVDRLFSYPFASEVFGFVRSWHNARSLDPGSPWSRLTVAIAYATEAFLFIADLNQSPFNVGTRLALDDFTPEQVSDLNRRHGAPLKNAAELERYYGLMGGHPYLVRAGLHEMMTRGIDLAQLQSEALRDDGPFGAHLRRLALSLCQDDARREAVRGVLAGKGCGTPAAFYRLRSAGVLTGESAEEARPRCELYRLYLERHLR